MWCISLRSGASRWTVRRTLNSRPPVEVQSYVNLWLRSRPYSTASDRSQSTRVPSVTGASGTCTPSTAARACPPRAACRAPRARPSPWRRTPCERSELHLVRQRVAAPEHEHRAVLRAQHESQVTWRRSASGSAASARSASVPCATWLPGAPATPTPATCDETRRRRGRPGEHPPVAVEHRDRWRRWHGAGVQATGTRSVTRMTTVDGSSVADLRPGDRGQRLDPPGDRTLVEEQQRRAVGIRAAARIAAAPGAGARPGPRSFPAPSRDEWAITYAMHRRARRVPTTPQMTYSRRRPSARRASIQRARSRGSTTSSKTSSSSPMVERRRPAVRSARVGTGPRCPWRRWCRWCRSCRWSSWVLEADPAHLGHEAHPGHRLHTVAHQREQLVDIRRGGARFGLDEVGVLLRDHRAADPQRRAARPPRR